MSAANLPLIDIDNPAYRPAADPIAEHDRLAKHYAFRAPYLDEFFWEVRDKLAIDSQTRLLDLCSGMGEVSQWLAGEVAHIDAVDGSAEMIEKARKFDNVTHHVADVNAEPPELAEPVDHIFIGSAIQWIRLAALHRIVAKTLRPNGAILVAYSAYDISGQPYAPALGAIASDHGRRDRAMAVFGENKLSYCGFEPVEQIDIARSVSVGYHVLYGEFLSQGYADFYETPPEDSVALRRRFTEALKPHMDEEGRVGARIINMAKIYRR